MWTLEVTEVSDAEIVQALAEKVMGYWSWDESDSEIWNPLTSDADACTVLDKMMTAHFSVGLSCGPHHRLSEVVWTPRPTDVDWLWTCVFIPGRVPLDVAQSLQVTDTSRQRTICLSALKAVGVEVGE